LRSPSNSSAGPDQVDQVPPLLAAVENSDVVPRASP